MKLPDSEQTTYKPTKISKNAPFHSNNETFHAFVKYQKEIERAEIKFVRKNPLATSKVYHV